MNRSDGSEMFASAWWYDVGIDWAARMKRELPLLCEVFGSPGADGLLDAGCGPGRHIVALASRGYRVTGLDPSAQMIERARENLADENAEATFIEAGFEALDSSDGPFDGVYCLGNSLAAGGSARIAQRAIAAFAAVLPVDRRLVIQVLNFEKLRNQSPRARGPRVRRDGDREYISTRAFVFQGQTVEVINVTHFKDDQWRHFVGTGTLYAVSPDELRTWCEDQDLSIDHRYGNYDRTPFDPAASDDLIVVATKH